MTAELPGVAQDAIKIAVSKDILKLEADGTRGLFSTIQALPFEPDQDRISVTFSQGVLAVSLKRKPDDVEHIGEKQVPIEAPVDASLEEMGLSPDFSNGAVRDVEGTDSGFLLHLDPKLGTKVTYTHETYKSCA